MTTTRDIINQALLEIRVTGSYGGADPQDSIDALAKLNRIMMSLTNDGLSYTHTNLALTDTFPFPANLENAAIMWLAKNIAGLFGKQLTAAQERAAKEGEEYIFAAYHTTPASVFDSGIIRLPSNRRFRF